MIAAPTQSTRAPRRTAPPADPVDARPAGDRLARDVAMDGGRGGQRHQAEPEQPRGVERVDDHTGKHQPEAAADAERRADAADGRGHAVVREVVADDPEGEREDAAADAL